MQLSRADAVGSGGEVPVARVRKPYHAPAYSRLSPDRARQMLLRNADDRDPAIPQMLDRMEIFSKSRDRQ